VNVLFVPLNAQRPLVTAVRKEPHVGRPRPLRELPQLEHEDGGEAER
jgi:hypothetical protein